MAANMADEENGFNGFLEPYSTESLMSTKKQPWAKKVSTCTHY